MIFRFLKFRFIFFCLCLLTLTAGSDPVDLDQASEPLSEETISPTAESHFYRRTSGASLSLEHLGSRIRVRWIKKAKSVAVRFSTSALLKNDKNQYWVLAKGKWTFFRKKQNHKWGYLVQKAKSSFFVPSQILKLQAEQVIVAAHGTASDVAENPLHFENGDQIEIRPGPSDSTLQLLQNPELENYVAGVLSWEMPSSAPLSALEANAIAIRSYAIGQKLSSRKAVFDVTPDIWSQVYKPVNETWNQFDGSFKTRKGKGKGKRSTAASILQAVQRTSGLILQNNEGQVQRGFFHADCGGGTDAPQTVWSPGPRTIKRLVSKDSCHLKSRTWNHKETVQSLTAKLLRYKKMKAEFLKSEGLSQIAISSKSASGRALEVRIVGALGTSVVVPAEAFRIAVNVNLLRSNLFQVRQDGDNVLFSGKGFGHGVGLCQAGAIEMAKQNKTAAEILKFYYPHWTIAPLPGRTRL